jgi:hypothetical protein
MHLESMLITEITHPYSAQYFSDDKDQTLHATTLFSRSDRRLVY